MANPRHNRFSFVVLRFTDHRFLLGSFSNRIPAAGLITTDQKTFRPKYSSRYIFALNVADHSFVLFPPVTFNRCHVSLSLSIYANSALSPSLGTNAKTPRIRDSSRVFYGNTTRIHSSRHNVFFFFFFFFYLYATWSWKRFGSKIQECTVVTVIINVTTIPCSSPMARIIKSYRVLFGVVWSSVFSVVLVVSLSRFVGRKRRQLRILCVYAATCTRYEKWIWDREGARDRLHLRHIEIFSTLAFHAIRVSLPKLYSRKIHFTFAVPISCISKRAISLREDCRNTIPFMKPHKAFGVVFPKKLPPSSRLSFALSFRTTFARGYVNTKPHAASILIEKVRLSHHRRWFLKRIDRLELCRKINRRSIGYRRVETQRFHGRKVFERVSLARRFNV